MNTFTFIKYNLKKNGCLKLLPKQFLPHCAIMLICALYVCYLLIIRYFTLKGWLYDKSGNYDAGFYFLGAVQAAGTLVLAADHLRKNYSSKKNTV